MNVLFIAPTRQDFLPVLKTLRRGRNSVAWFSGVFNNLYRELASNQVYLNRVNPRSLGKVEIEKVDLGKFDLAVVDLSADREFPETLDFGGSTRPTEIVSALTMAGLVVIGISRDGKFLPQLDRRSRSSHDRRP
ncbi:MAG: hypothetical protein K8F91_10330 [Candidatus Obscuribacterales bacterium]|nr:hypothetical protein [Candidatus Obscuribacterales bacterium]